MVAPSGTFERHDIHCAEMNGTGFAARGFAPSRRVRVFSACLLVRARAAFLQQQRPLGGGVLIKRVLASRVICRAARV